MLEPPPLPEVPEPEPELKQYPDPELDDEPYVQTYVEKGFIKYRTLHEQIKFITEHSLEAWQTRVAEIKKNIKDFAKLDNPSELETFTAVRSLKDSS